MSILLSDKYVFYLMAAYGVALIIFVVLGVVSRYQLKYLRQTYQRFKNK